MENSFTQAVLMTALFITLVAGCEQIPTTSDNPPETTAGDRLLTLPQSGSTPAPELAKSAQTNSQKVSATMMMLKQLRQQSPDAPFAGVLSLLQNPGEEEKDYTYHQINLPFSKGITQRSEGVDLMYRYVVRTESNEILLQFEAVIPKDDKAVKLVKKWIEKKILSKAGGQKRSSDKKQAMAEPVASSVGDCNAILDPGNCEATLWVEGFGWILDCGLTVCAAAPDEWPPPPPDDPDWTDPNDCDDPTGFDCGGTGGGDSDGGGGSGDDCDPGAIDQPAGCEEPVDEPEPCNTEDANIDSLSSMGVLDLLWQSSFGEFTNGTPPPQDQRKEKGGWLIADDSDQLSFQPFPAGLEASICTIQNVPPPPAGAVSVVHTHPMFPEERVKETSCVNRVLDKAGITDPDIRSQWHASGVKYRQEPSRADLEYAKEHTITSYYMDGTLIEKYYDGTSNQQVTQLESRCGY